MKRGHSRHSYPHDKPLPLHAGEQGRTRWFGMRLYAAVKAKMHTKKQRQHDHALERAYQPGDVLDMLVQNDRGERKWLTLDPENIESIERFLDESAAFLGLERTNGRQDEHRMDGRHDERDSRLPARE